MTTKTRPTASATDSTATPAEERVQVDALVRGKHGTTDREGEGRVYHVSPWGWVSVWLPDPDILGGQQSIFYPGRFEVVGPPRPTAQRRDIPDRLKR